MQQLAQCIVSDENTPVPSMDPTPLIGHRNYKDFLFIKIFYICIIFLSNFIFLLIFIVSSSSKLLFLASNSLGVKYPSFE